MKSNFLKLSYFAIAATGLLSACNQENISSDVVNPDKTLTISVNPSDFIPVDAESRAVTADDLSSTTFENGDELGLFVISTNSDNMVYYDNVKFTYDGAQWTPEKEIYSYRYSKYVAYYPYNAELSLEDKTAAGITGSIKNAFAASIPADQSTADAFEKADLLLAEGVEADGAVTFDLKHQFSLVEIKVPVQKYITAKGYGDSQEKFTYNAPFVLSWYKDLKLDETVITPFNAGKGALRYIFNPESESSNSIVINGNVMYDDIPYNFGQETAYTLELTAGQYKRYNVTVSGVGESVIERDLEVGDYYYSDGSIYPYGNQDDNDKSYPVKDGCIGVIYDVENANDTDGTNSWNHGYVLALSDAGSSQWGGATVQENINAWNDVLDDEKKDNGNPAYTDDDKAVFDAILSRYDGYASSVRLLSSEGSKDALNMAKSYSKQAPAIISSGWYLPSIGQIYLMMENLGELGFEGNYVSLSHLFFGKTRSQTQKVAARDKINSYLMKIDENSTISGIWKSVTEVDSNNSWAIEWKNEDIKLFSRSKTSSDKVRPVLSF